MKVSLVITTYNWKEALVVVLKSATQQSVLPHEIIIADDGSKKDTQQVIEQFRQNSPVPILHAWQPDDGFRAAESRNRAMAKASGDYIVIIDGDIYLPVHFIRDHIEAALPGQFIQGGRAMLNEPLTYRVLNDKLQPTIFCSGVKNRKNMLRGKWLSKCTSRVWNSDRSTRSCNMSFWRKDVVAVNGFNNDMVGWGREDSEFVVRLLNSGLNRLYLKFSGVGFHLYHNENSRESLSVNDGILKNTIEQKLSYCENGISKFL